ncbi:hypothetical protein [Paraclostridium sordellii]|uniref:hypothetical protein n=1 Tax=Paraclostridium sordellii TaxID=1505 RepID=UPI0005E09CD3|nr:hypothetical protein [Paeniclostridium sordellii]CEQ14813.1 Uncharacterised protein [[Clostridium] sordellii] [Paeniclostridium sordellii]
MALENGTGILDYEDLESCLENYKIDNTIFNKAFMLLNLYMNKPSWPHSVKLYEEEAEKILGGSIYSICRMGGQLKPYFDNEENKNINKEFKRDLSFFALNIFTVLDDAYSFRMNPFELNSVSYTINEHECDKVCVKFSRNDNESLDVYMSKFDIRNMIDYLEKLLAEG